MDEVQTLDWYIEMKKYYKFDKNDFLQKDDVLQDADEHQASSAAKSEKTGTK